MTDLPALAVVPGQAITGVVVAVEGDLVAVRLLSSGATVPVEVGGLDVLPGYAHAWTQLVADRLPIGQPVRLVWIGRLDSGLMHAHVEGRWGSPDVEGIAKGWALPHAGAMRVETVRTVYRNSLTTAARDAKGGWNDALVADQLRQQAAVVLGPSSEQLRPTYFAMHPALSISLVALVIAGIAWQSRRDNQEVFAENREAGRGWIRGPLAFIRSAHTRLFRFRIKPTAAPAAEPDGGAGKPPHA